MMRDNLQVMATHQKRDRMAGLRFAQLIRQLIDDGWTQTAIAEAIDCDIGLISKTLQLLPQLSGGVVQKGLRDDVIQGIYDGLGVQANYLIMPVPRNYPNRVRLKNGETRACEKNELDHKDFKVISNVELEIARDRKERAAIRDDVGELRTEVRANAAVTSELAEQVAKLLAAMGVDSQNRSVK